MGKRLKEKLTTRNQQGFTIIEVVLVLAIAGLIFLVVFLAVPQLQRSQRDTQRRADLGRFMTTLETYSSNNNGRYPNANAAGITGANGLVPRYLTVAGSQFADPSTGSVYTFSYTADTMTTSTAIGTMYYRTGRICDTSSEGVMTATGANARNVAAMVRLENGIASCQDNR